MSRNENIRKRKVNKRKRRKKAVLIVFLLFSVALLCGLSLTVFFPVKEISASGSNLYSAEEIIAHCGIMAEENLLRISEDNVLSSLQKKLPFVDGVKLTKKLPGTVKITVTDASEIYVFKIDDIYYSADDEGRVLKTYNEMPDNLLFIDCTAQIGDGTVTYIKFEDEKVNEIIKFISKQTENFTLKADYLDLTDLYAIEMSFDSRFTVNFGEFDYFEEKLAHLIKMLEQEELADKSGSVNLSQYTPQNPKAFFVEK